MTNSLSQQPINRRQRFLLELLQGASEGVLEEDIHRMVCFYTHCFHADCYQFVPTAVGPYSFQLVEDLGVLLRSGLILYDPPAYRAAGEQCSLLLFGLPSLQGDDLARRIYRDHPYYGIYDENLDWLFEEAEQAPITAVREGLHREEAVVLTLCCEDRGLDAFVNHLIDRDVRFLCDVRKRIPSRQMGLSQGALRRALEAVHIGYLYKPEVGIQATRKTSQAGMRRRLEKYRAALTRKHTHLSTVAALAHQHRRIALLCPEDPDGSQRHILCAALAERYRLACENA